MNTADLTLIITRQKNGTEKQFMIIEQKEIEIYDKNIKNDESKAIKIITSSRSCENINNKMSLAEICRGLVKDTGENATNEKMV